MAPQGSVHHRYGLLDRVADHPSWFLGYQAVGDASLRDLSCQTTIQSAHMSAESHDAYLRSSVKCRNGSQDADQFLPYWYRLWAECTQEVPQLLQ